MGIARMHGGKESFVRGHSKHLDECDTLLVKAGWEFRRRTAHEGNAYVKNGLPIVIVSSTPRVPTQEVKRIQKLIVKLGGDQVPTETTQKPTAPLIAMADTFLTTEPAPGNVRAIKARNAALAGWVKRVLTKHGPLQKAVLMGAMEEMGFKHTARFNARKEAGAFGFRVNGESFVGLDYQVPEDARSVGGRPRSEPARGVQATTHEEELAGTPDETLEAVAGLDLPGEAHVIGENNGAGPEPREDEGVSLAGFGPETSEEPSEAPSDAALVDKAFPLMSTIPAPSLPPLDSWPGGTLPPAPEGAELPFQREDGDVLAAAQLLIQSLGIKTAHPRMTEGLDSLDEYLGDLIWRLEQAREKVSVLKGLIS